MVECSSYFLRLGYLDGLVRRRLELSAQYDLKCSLLDDKITRTTIQVTADSHSADLIHIICNQGLIFINRYHGALLIGGRSGPLLLSSLKKGDEKKLEHKAFKPDPLHRCCQTRPNKSLSWRFNAVQISTQLDVLWGK